MHYAWTAITSLSYQIVPNRSYGFGFGLDFCLAWFVRGYDLGLNIGLAVFS